MRCLAVGPVGAAPRAGHEQAAANVSHLPVRLRRWTTQCSTPLVTTTTTKGLVPSDSAYRRAELVAETDAKTLLGFVADHAAEDATVYTDDATAYKGMPFKHDSVRHSTGEYVKDMTHTNGIESFWSMLRQPVEQCSADRARPPAASGNRRRRNRAASWVDTVLALP